MSYEKKAGCNPPNPDPNNRPPVPGGSGRDYRIGLAVKPKMRAHPYFGEIGIVRGILPESENIRESMKVEIITIKPHPILHEPTDDWMTA